MEPSDFDLASACAVVSRAIGPWGTVLHDDTLVFVLRGTAGWREWAQNLLPLMIDSPIGGVHAGFLTGASEILDAGAVKLAAGGRFVLCGHSRGGALAVVLGGLLKARGYVAEAIVTFGAPRAGDQRLHDYLVDIPMRQYRNGEDAVPMWPDPPFCHGREPLHQVGMPVHPVEDHAIGRYVEGLRQHEQKARDYSPALGYRAA